MSEKLILSPQLFVAEGTDRKCYRHPDKNDLCIKVLHPDVRPGRFWREARYYARLQRRGALFTHLSAYHGIVDTDLGKAILHLFEFKMADDCFDLLHGVTPRDGCFVRRARG